MARDFATLGLDGTVLPGDSGCALLPPRVTGVDIENKLELHEIVLTVKGAAEGLEVGDRLRTNVGEWEEPWGDGTLTQVSFSTEPPLIPILELYDDVRRAYEDE